MKPFSGLTEADAAARLQAEGHNELPQAGSAHAVSHSHRGAARADAGAASGRRHRLPGARRSEGGDHPGRLRDHVDRDHRGAGDADRARAGGAARPHEPPRARHSRRRAQADRRPRRRAGRPHRSFRRRPGACRRRSPAVHGSAGRRIDPDRRIRAGAQGRLGRPRQDWTAASGRRRPAAGLFRFAGGARLGTGGSNRHRRAKRDRQDRPVAGHASKPNRRACRCRRGASSGCSPFSAAASACSRCCSTASCAADGWMPCWPELRSACRCCRKSFRSS